MEYTIEERGVDFFLKKMKAPYWISCNYILDAKRDISMYKNYIIFWKGSDDMWWTVWDVEKIIQLEEFIYLYKSHRIEFSKVARRHIGEAEEKIRHVLEKQRYLLVENSKQLRLEV
jgi:hypothetical protein